MAERVAEWPKKYGIDGIDLDLEEGAGNRFILYIFLAYPKPAERRKENL
jgi:hypothetical protein